MRDANMRLSIVDVTHSIIKGGAECLNRGTLFLNRGTQFLNRGTQFLNRGTSKRKNPRWIKEESVFLMSVSIILNNHWYIFGRFISKPRFARFGPFKTELLSAKPSLN